MTSNKVPLEIVTVDRPDSGSGCAGAANPELPRFAGDVEWLRQQVTALHRIDPRETGTPFPDLPKRAHEALVTGRAPGPDQPSPFDRGAE